MNLGIESETLEFKKTTGELEKAVDDIASMLNKHGHNRSVPLRLMTLQER